MAGETVKLKSESILPMMSSDSAAVCSGAVVATSTSVVVVDLTTVLGLIPEMPTPGGIPGSTGANPLGNFLSLQAEGADCYIVFGPTFASVSSGKVPSPTATNTVNGSTGAVTQRNQICFYLPAGCEQDYNLPLGPGAPGASGGYGAGSQCRFLAVITATGTGYLRMWQSNPAT
jgi:hypothetical protein